MRNLKRYVNLNALVQNFDALSKLSAPADCAAVVKADGYGLGMIEVSRVLFEAGCRNFFVATLEEGELLRQQLPLPQIYVLNGISGYPPARFHQARLLPVINSLGDIQTWSAAGSLTDHGCALHIDTGMQRLGLTAGEFAAITADPGLQQRLNPVLLMSHLVSAEIPAASINQQQLKKFNDLMDGLPAAMQQIPKSLANSSGIVLGAAFHFDLCRAGAACYGVKPQPTHTSPMQPVVEISAPIIQIREVNKTGSVGYGSTANIGAGSRLATIAAGYADGYPRHASNRAQVQIGEWLAPVVGNVSMDLISVDISHLPTGAVCVGDPVLLVGPLVTIDQLAEAAGTIGYELLTNLGRLTTPEYQT